MINNNFISNSAEKYISQFESGEISLKTAQELYLKEIGCEIIKDILDLSINSCVSVVLEKVNNK